MSKAKAQIRHAKRRARQRFGVSLDVRWAVTEIQKDRAMFVERQSLRLTKWKLIVKGEEMILIYDSKRKTIVTCLFKEEDANQNPQNP